MRRSIRAIPAARSINARGELIGINTAIFSETGGYQGIGFAVPSNLARHVMDDLLKYGEVQRGTIPGVQHRDHDHADRGGAGAPNTRGALVNQIRASEAYPAGLRAGDIIISFNGRSVEDASALMRMLGRLEDRHRRAPRNPAREPPPRGDRADHALTLDARCALALREIRSSVRNPPSTPG